MAQDKNTDRRLAQQAESPDRADEVRRMLSSMHPEIPPAAPRLEKIRESYHPEKADR